MDFKNVKNFQLDTLGSLSISCHPAAVSAYLFSTRSKYQFQRKRLNKESSSTYIETEFPIIINSDNNDFEDYCISGWNWINSYEQNTQLIVLRFKGKLTEHEIEKISWIYAMKNQMFSFNRKSSLSQFNSLIKNIPSQLINELFKIKHKKALSTHVTSEFLGEKIHTVNHQIHKNRISQNKSKNLIIESVLENL